MPKVADQKNILKKRPDLTLQSSVLNILQCMRLQNTVGYRALSRALVYFRFTKYMEDVWSGNPGILSSFKIVFSSWLSS